MKRSLIILATTIVLAACGGSSSEGTPEEQLAALKKERTELDKKISELEKEVSKDKPVQATPVAVKEMVATPFRSYINVQGSVTGDENVLATPQAPGVITNVHVSTGQFVKRGQILATLEAASVEQQIKAQEAQLTLTKQLYEKQSKLWSQNIGSEIQLLQAKANYESSQKQYEALLAQRDMYRIKSPISGTVDAVDVKVGDATGPGQRGIRVVSVAKLKAKATLGENYIGKVNKGDQVILEFDETGTTINSKLNYVSRSVDEISRAFSVEVWLGSRKDIRPNMSCKMKILNYENNKALTLPVAAVQKTAEGEMVFVVKDGKAKSVIVETGRTSNGNIEILKGINPGDKVVIEGYAEVDDNRPVEVM